MTYEIGGAFLLGLALGVLATVAFIAWGQRQDLIDEWKNSKGDE